MPDGIIVQVISILILMMILAVISIDLTFKNILKPAIILAIIIGLLSIVGVWVMLSHGLFSYRYNIIPKK
ncbi:hypothetical protein [Lactococcus lactis]|uniref:hypothetical protein n=1 Tax=Lactococcus lactis TaxID=1358 RepID=UPI002891781D|nr:hypothetical protein [Lactococcus lactis]MDT2898500.1 hypothetical protein [Lactococcus lactis]